MTDQPVLPGYAAVADAVASLALAGPPMGHALGLPRSKRFGR
jgi:hypothetical protein